MAFCFACGAIFPEGQEHKCEPANIPKPGQEKAGVGIIKIIEVPLD